MPEMMVVDDDPEIVDGMLACLGARGRAAAGYVDARRALADFEAAPERFDCVVTDIFMPEMDGLELIQAIRRASPTVPIIAVTGNRHARVGVGFIFNAAGTFGADAVFPKPYRCQEICDVAGRLLRERRGVAA